MFLLASPTTRTHSHRRRRRECSFLVLHSPVRDTFCEAGIRVRCHAALGKLRDKTPSLGRPANPAIGTAECPCDAMYVRRLE